jgi:hypothetical protein
MAAFNGPVLGFGIPVMSIWALTGLAGHWEHYTVPWLAAAVFIGSLVLPMAIWRLGPRGIGPGASLLSIVGTLGLSAALADQIDDRLLGEIGIGNWITSWGAATYFVLAFARPVEEIVVAFVAFVSLNYWLDFPADPDVYLLHSAPARIGAVVPGAVALLALTTALRSGVRRVARSRDLASAAEQRLAISEAVSRERTERFVSWEADVAPLLEDLADGRRDVTDPAVIARCRDLATQMRAQLSATADSLFSALLQGETGALRARGGDLSIQDVDVGFRLPEADRLRLAALVADVCHGPGAPSVELTLMDAGDASTLVVLSVSGAPQPDTPGWVAARQQAGSMLSVDTATRWFWDAAFPLDPAPAMPKSLTWADPA